LSFRACLFEGSSLERSDGSIGAVNLFHSEGTFDAQFIQCEFRNNINGSVQFISEAQSSGSSLLIDTCVFHKARNSNLTVIDGHYEYIESEEEISQRSFYAAVTLLSLNASAYIRNSVFRGLSVHNIGNNSDAFGEHNKELLNGRYRNNINVVDEPDQAFYPYGSLTAAIYSLMFGHPNDESSLQTNVTIDNCTFQNNSAAGGAVHIGSGPALIIQSSFESNTGSLGGAISASDQYIGQGNPPLVQIYSCQFINNSASAHGGAFYMANSNLTFANSIFELNSALYGSVGFVDGSNFSQKTSIRLEDCVFRDNIALDIGGIGSIYALGASLEIHNITLESSHSYSEQVFFYLLSSVMNAENVTVYGISLLNMNGGVVSLVDVRIDMTNEIILAGGSLSCDRCNLNNMYSCFQFNLAAQLYLRDSNLTENRGFLITSEGGVTGAEVVFDRCLFFENIGSLNGYYSNITILSSTMILHSMEALVFELEESRFSISDSTVLLPNEIDFIISAEGEFYFSNTTIENIQEADHEPGWVLSNMTDPLNFVAVNCKFSSFVLDIKVQQVSKKGVSTTTNV